jgi:Flp pilus assembly protein TadD
MRRMSDINMRRGDTEAALAWAHKSIDTKPLDAAGHHHLAGLHLQVGDAAAAEAAARRAHELAPADAPIRQRLDYIELSASLPS